MVEITENRYQSDLLALIYGFSQDGSSKFTGSLKYMQKWLQCSRTTAVKTADQLVASGLILKDSETINGVTFNRYSVDLERVKNMRTGGTPEVRGGTLNVRGGTSGVRGGTRGVSNNTNYIPIDNTNYNTSSDFGKSQDGSENTFISPPDLEKEKSSAKKEKDPAVDVIEYFNYVTGQNRSTAKSGRGSSNVRWVRALIQKGYTPEEIKLMIDVKTYEWSDSPKMARHLNPVTLFKRHGEEYIEDAIHMRDNPKAAQALKESKGKKGYAPTVSQSDYDNLKNW